MSKQTKLLVIKSKELILTLFFLLIGIIVICFLFHIINPDMSNKSPSSDTQTATSTNSVETIYIPPYSPYQTTFIFAGIPLDLKINSENDKIVSIELTNLDAATKSMYPLLEPALKNINDQLANNIPLEEITYSSETQYTSIILLDAIKNSLSTSKE